MADEDHYYEVSRGYFAVIAADIRDQKGKEKIKIRRMRFWGDFPAVSADFLDLIFIFCLSIFNA